MLRGVGLGSEAPTKPRNTGGAPRQGLAPQFSAISWNLAETVVERLRHGDFESLGVNGWAVVDESQGLAGIRVAGVQSGSPALRARLEPGDIILTMNGLPVGTDGTFKDYCDVIRTSGQNPIALEVLRFDSGEVLCGEINGDRPL